MAATSDVGYFTLELESLQLTFVAASTEELLLKVEIEIINGAEVLKWDDNTALFRTASIKPRTVDRLSGGRDNSTDVDAATGDKIDAKEDKSVTCIVDFNGGLYKRSSYISLDNNTVCSLSNALVTVRCFQIREAAAVVQEAPSKKGTEKQPAVAVILEEKITEMIIPLSSLLVLKGHTINGAFCFDNAILRNSSEHEIRIDTAITGFGINLNGAESFLSFKLAADNDLAEFCMGSVLMIWDGIILNSPPLDWLLNSPDIVEAKAKVQPSVEELKKRYIENIEKLILNQSKLVTYTATISNNDDEKDTENNRVGRVVFPLTALSNGQLHFNSELAKLTPMENDLRTLRSLWSVSWTKSDKIFVHRSVARQVVASLRASSRVSSDSTGAYVLSLSKNPTQEGATAVTGGVGSLVADFDISPISICSPDEDPPRRLKFAATFRGASNEVEKEAVINKNTEGADEASSEGKEDISSDIPEAIYVDVTMTAPLFLPTPRINNNKTFDDVLPEHVQKIAPLKIGDKDALKELRVEITSVIKTIAQEYIEQYPVAVIVPPPTASKKTTSTVAPSADGIQDALADRKVNFLHYLSTSGVYHNFKEKLKPKIQRVARERYGARGQALGYSAVKGLGFKSSNAPDGVNLVERDQERIMDEVLGELYVFLLKETNCVLNLIYTETIIDRDIKEFDVSNGYLDDEIENPEQLFKRLLVRALDAESDCRPSACEQLHLERVQMTLKSALLKPDVTVYFKYEAYTRYGEFCLRQSALNCTAAAFAENPEKKIFLVIARNYAAKGREALEISYVTSPTEWRSALLLACRLIESDQRERAELIFSSLLNSQFNDGDDSRYSFCLDEFDGYDSDRLIPVNPICYACLAAYYSLLRLPLKCRKALRLTYRSFVEGNHFPPVSTHGTPRRTVVICLSQACELMFQYGCTALGKECLKLAEISDRDIATKIAARNLSGDTVPHVRHILHTCRTYSLLAGPSLVELTVDPWNAPNADSDNEDVGEENEEDESSQSNKNADLELSILSASDSIDAAVDLSDQLKGYLCLAKALTTAKAENVRIIESYLRTFQLALEHTEVSLIKEIPLDSFLQCCKYMLVTGRYQESMDLLLTGCAHHSSASLFLLLGIAAYRLDRLEDAEDALQESNLLENNNPDVWAYLSLVCLACGPHRKEEAQLAVVQAERLGICSSGILRELGTCFMAADKIQVAEDLVRRAVAEEIKQSTTGRANPRTRQLLADILTVQNQAVLAVDEYQQVLADETADRGTKQSAGDKCASLLQSMGRSEELRSLLRLMAVLIPSTPEYTGSTAIV